MAELTVIAKAKAKPGCEKDLERELMAVMEPTHREPGCIRYVLHRSVDDSAVFTMVERWDSKDSLDLHLASPHIKALFAKMPMLISSAPELSIYEIIPAGTPEKGHL